MADISGRQVYGSESLGSISGTFSASNTLAGYTLGEKRTHNGVDYVLAYNKCNSAIDQGMLCAATIGCGVLPYSVTVSTVTESIANIVGWNNNATAATNCYFWMGVHGFPASLRASNISIATGVYVGPAGNGKVVTTDTTGNYVAINIGDTTAATAQTDGSGGAFGRFYVFGFDRTKVAGTRF